MPLAASSVTGDCLVASPCPFNLRASMWRLCDLHTHTLPNEQEAGDWSAEEFIQSCVDLRLDVVAVTDHDHLERVEDAVAAAEGSGVKVVPGIEVSTDRGHILAIAPNPDGSEQLSRYVARLGVAPTKQVSIDEMIRIGRTDFPREIILIGAHVDADKSLLASNNPLSVEGQMDLASSMDALEVEANATLQEWLDGGVKQRKDNQLALVQGSDRHGLDKGSGRRTWMYLPEVDVKHFRHAFAVPEASIRFDSAAEPPATWIESITFSGGFHDGLTIEFCERTNAVIGPPNVGKTLVVDALKFAFDITTGITEVDELTQARMNACLSPGDSIRVLVRTEEGTKEIERTVGAATIPSRPMTPIVFSQTELIRRAHEPEPSIELLDIHHSGTALLKKKLKGIAQQVHESFYELWDKADEARKLAETVENPLDGLAATRKRLGELSGAEGVAKRSNDVARVEDWRRRLRQNVEAWVAATDVSMPEVPPVPEFETTDSAIRDQIPTAEVMAAQQKFAAAHKENKAALRTALEDALNGGEKSFEAVKKKTVELLEAEGFTAGSDALSEIDDLRTRALSLEKTAADLKQLDTDLQAGIDRLAKDITKLGKLREFLRALRKRTCSRVNSSMRSFAARLSEDAVTEQIDELIDDLKTGTWLGADARAELRKNLDRQRILERALRLHRNDLSALPDSKETESQDEVVREATERGKLKGLVELACLWPGDGLELLYLRDNPPKQFSKLTEGLRALAIKEISFADSPLPVITDQPEDAVPTRSVYENLVPTLRTQRATRQFLVISHDANIVVAGDVDKVIVITGEKSQPISQGTLLDDTIRVAALEHLEGGEAAFEVRSRRYGHN